MYAAPTSVTLSLTSINTVISWNQTSLCQYTVQVSTDDGDEATSTIVNDPRIMLTRNYSLSKLEISSCSLNSTFIIGRNDLICLVHSYMVLYYAHEFVPIMGSLPNSKFLGPCLFNEVYQHYLSRTYQVFLDGNWKISCTNSSTTFNSTCKYQNDTWNPNMCIGKKQCKLNKTL